MEFTTYVDRLNAFTKKKDTEWDIFLDEFRKTNPEPIRQEVHLIETKVSKTKLGIKFWLALAAGIGALFLSGFRVAERFYSVAGGYSENANLLFTYGESISAVLAVNVTIFALAIAYAYTKGRMSENSQVFGLGTAVLISAVAGLGQAFKLLGSEWSSFVSLFDLVLAFVVGIGATLLEIFSGDLLGVELVRFFAEQRAERNTINEQNRINSEQYEQNVLLSDAEYAEQHKAWIRSAKQQFPNWMSQFTKWNEQNERTVNVPNGITEQNRTHKAKNGTFSEFVLSTLSTYFEKEHRVLSFGELNTVLAEQLVMKGRTEQEAAELLGKKKPQVSELRKRFVQQNQQ